MGSHGKHGKNKGKNRRLRKHYKFAKLGKASKRVSAHLNKIGGGRIGNKLLGFWLDFHDEYDGMISNSHERKRVKAKFIAERANR